MQPPLFPSKEKVETGYDGVCTDADKRDIKKAHVGHFMHVILLVVLTLKYFLLPSSTYNTAPNSRFL